MHICIGNLTIIGSDNGLSPGRRQAIIWTNAGILLIGSLVTNFSEIFIEIHVFIHDFWTFDLVFKNVVCKMAAIFSRPLCINDQVKIHLLSIIYPQSYKVLCYRAGLVLSTKML